MAVFEARRLPVAAIDLRGRVGLPQRAPVPRFWCA
jgi:hypothetical protein